MHLSKFPATFGLDLSTHSKGDFPFKFNPFENQNYVGPMPGLEFHAIDTKSEMYKYCSQDVTILRLCCVEFRNTFLNETGVDPFCYCTIAASVMAVYHSKYLKENTI